MLAPRRPRRSNRNILSDLSGQSKSSLSALPPVPMVPVSNPVSEPGSAASPPPPGAGPRPWAAPGTAAPPGWAPGPPPPGWQPQPVAHKPGIVPLRPLRLGDMYDGAFAALRRNPRAMIGIAAVVMTGVLLLPTLASVLLALAGELAGPFGDDLFAPPPSGEQPASPELPSSMLLVYAGQLLAALAVLVVTGLVVHVVAQAVLGHKVTSGEAWGAVRGRILRLLGLSLLSWLLAVLPVLVAVTVGVILGVVVDPVVGALVGVPLGLLALVAMVWFYVRFAVLAPAALILERLGVADSLRRAGALTKAQFWRVFGIVLLTQLVAGIASGLLSTPFSLVGVFGFLVVSDEWTGLVYVLGTYLGMLVSYSLATPFTAAVTVLQYFDQRIRKEGYDVELIAAGTGR